VNIRFSGKAASHSNKSHTLLLSSSCRSNWCNTLEKLLELSLHKKSTAVHWTPVKRLSGTSMRCSTSWRSKSGSFIGCSADPYTVSIVCAPDRSETPFSGDRPKKSANAVYSIHICNGSILHCKSAAAFGSNGALADLSIASSIIPKLPFLPSKCRNYAIFISSSE
jgi:hypothetical protein